MALYILYPNGTTAKLCRCNWIRRRSDGQHDAFNGEPDNGGTFIARIPADCVVSFDHFNHVEATTTSTDLTKQNALSIVNATIKTLSGWANRKEIGQLKKTLAGFDARTGEWK